MLLVALAAALTSAAVAVPAFAAAKPIGTIKGVVGPGFTISVTSSTKPKKAGLYTLSVEDKASIHNFRLSGPGVSVATDVGATGKKTFKVNLKAGATYRFVCDPHASSMKGSFKVPK
jgi:plastocyanin